MNDKKWEQFFSLLQEIMDMGGSYQEKAAAVKSQAIENNADGALEEFLTWFPDEE